jgi:collagenase-like PrtC family protease
VTITVPYLIELVRAEFPELPVSVSVICEVDNAQMLRLFERYGVERVYLAEECNRDMNALKLLSQTATAELGLLLNNGCLRHCHMRNYHFLLASQASQSDKPVDRYVDYPLLKCSAERARNPVEVLRAPWIRPEDLCFYEKRFGISVFKIVGRQLPLESIVRMASAYARLAYEGNFLDLLSTPQAANFARHPTTAEAAAVRGTEHYAPPELYVDNGRLGKLTRAIFARGGCGPLRDCESCRLCDKLLGDVVTVDHEAARLAHAGALEDLIGELARGEWSAEDPGLAACPAVAEGSAT